MPESRPHKRLRRQITETTTEDDDDANGEYDTIYVKSHEASKASSPKATQSVAMSRSRRSGASAVSPSALTPSVTVSRSPSGSPEERRRSIKLNFKMPASKLREVTGVSNSTSQRKSVAANSRDSFEGGELVRGPRSSRNQKKLVDYSEEVDEDEEEEEPEPEEDEDLDDFDQVGAEAEGGTDDEDIEMEDAPPAVSSTTVKFRTPKAPPSKPAPRSTPRSTPKETSKPAPKGTAANPATVKPVEEKEMELDPDDDELSDEEDLEEDEDEEEEEEDIEGEQEDEDAEGEDDDEIGGDTTLVTAADQDELDDSEDGLGGGSRGSTPDYARLTKRQRGRGEEEGAFLALPMEPQIKKHFTAEEHRMRRAEMARRRKNLSEKRNEEEKMTTINKLLKKQTTKKRGKSLAPDALAAAAATSAATADTSDAEADRQTPEEVEYQKADPLFVRWVNNRDGCRVGVPEEWLGKKVGWVFGGGGGGGGNERNGGMGLVVEEVP